MTAFGTDEIKEKFCVTLIGYVETYKNYPGSGVSDLDFYKETLPTQRGKFTLQLVKDGVRRTFKHKRHLFALQSEVYDVYIPHTLMGRIMFDQIKDCIPTPDGTVAEFNLRIAPMLSGSPVEVREFAADVVHNLSRTQNIIIIADHLALRHICSYIVKVPIAETLRRFLPFFKGIIITYVGYRSKFNCMVRIIRPQADGTLRAEAKFKMGILHYWIDPDGHREFLNPEMKSVLTHLITNEEPFVDPFFENDGTPKFKDESDDEESEIGAPIGSRSTSLWDNEDSNDDEEEEYNMVDTIIEDDEEEENTSRPAMSKFEAMLKKLSV